MPSNINSEQVYKELLAVKQLLVNRIGKKLLVPLTYNDHKMDYQLDTAAARNVITFRDYEKVGKHGLQPSEVVIMTFNGKAMPSCGKTLVRFKELPKPIKFEVVKSYNHLYPLIGVDTCLNTGMIKIEKTVDALQIKPGITRDWLTKNYMYDDMLRGLRLMREEYEIKIDKAIPPVQHRLRRNLAMMKNNVIQKIRELEDANVISQIDELTNWSK